MPGLPWVRLDANIYAHDKIAALTTERAGPRAFMLYICALAWAGGQGTNGHIPTHMVPILHGTRPAAELLVKHELWDTEGNEGWRVHNFADRQQLTETTDSIREARREAGRRGGLEAARRRRGTTL